MKNKTITLSYTEFETWEELSVEHQNLVKEALQAAEQSYSPYSQFPVGAAVLLEDGQVFRGSNQENLSFPAGTCAERSVLHYVGANVPQGKIKTIAITALRSTSASPVTPCGICRQVMSESENRQGQEIEVLLHKVNGSTYRFTSTAALLPLAFEETLLSQP
jgi:cytidine deaminase